MSRHIIIGTRGSALALKQAELTKAALLAIDPALTISIQIISTTGDTNQQPIPLDTIGKGWFTKEIETALLAGDIHLAIHSLKDMADEMPAGLAIGAYLARADARDVLITKKGVSLAELKPGAVIGTDSARRQVQMLALRSDVVIKSIRGNVPTRLEKLATEGYDAIILAAAGLKRLGLEDRITQYFSVQEMTPAPGQGILAVQVKAGDTDLDTLLAHINDPQAEHAAVMERAYSQAQGGGCKSPVGAYAYQDAGTWRLIGMHVDEGGHIVREVQ